MQGIFDMLFPEGEEPTEGIFSSLASSLPELFSSLSQADTGGITSLTDACEKLVEPLDKMRKEIGEFKGNLSSIEVPASFNELERLAGNVAEAMEILGGNSEEWKGKFEDFFKGLSEACKDTNTEFTVDVIGRIIKVTQDGEFEVDVTPKQDNGGTTNGGPAGGSQPT